MGRKKGPVGAEPAQNAFELKPFCYYCDKEFDTAKTLIQHQRTRHFNCAECGLKFDTVTGLRVHMLNAYKKTMKEVPNSIPGRENPDIVVHGMEGLPKGIVEERTKKAMEEKAEQDRVRAEKRAAERGAEEEAEKKGERERDKQKKPAPPEPPPPAPAPAPAPVPPPPVQTAYYEQPRTHEPAPVPAAAPPSGGMMSGLSPAVAKLLAGTDDADNGDSVPGLVNLPCVPEHVVPGALSKLHSVALQVLAHAGVLLPKKSTVSGDAAGLGGAGAGGAQGGFELPQLKRMRVN